MRTENYEKIVMEARAREREKAEARIRAFIEESRGKDATFLFGKMTGLNVEERRRANRELVL